MLEEVRLWKMKEKENRDFHSRAKIPLCKKHDDMKTEGKREGLRVICALLTMSFDAGKSQCLEQKIPESAALFRDGLPSWGRECKRPIVLKAAGWCPFCGC